MYLKFRNSIHTSGISSLKYVFIVLSNKSDAKIYINDFYEMYLKA